MATSYSQRREISLLFEGAAEFIPPHILEAVKATLFSAKRKHNLNHETFKDLIQTCVAKIWSKEQSFESKPPAYFGGVVNNTVMDYLRSGDFRSRYDASAEDGAFSVSEIAVMKEAVRQMYTKPELDDLISQVLNDQEAAVIKLTVFEELTYYETSIRLGMSVSTVKHRRADAIQKLGSSLRIAALGKA